MVSVGGGDQQDVVVRQGVEAVAVGLATTTVDLLVQATGIGPMGPAGPTGPTGPAGVWIQITQAAYDALPVKDPAVLYVVIG